MYILFGRFAVVFIFYYLAKLPMIEICWIDVDDIVYAICTHLYEICDIYIYKSSNTLTLRCQQ